MGLKRTCILFFVKLFLKKIAQLSFWVHFIQLKSLVDNLLYMYYNTILSFNKNFSNLPLNIKLLWIKKPHSHCWLSYHQSPRNDSFRNSLKLSLFYDWLINFFCYRHHMHYWLSIGCKKYTIKNNCETKPT